MLSSTNGQTEEYLDAWAWGRGHYATDEIEGFTESLQYLLRFLQTEGPFVGIVGFSSGATTASILVSLAERGASPEIMQSMGLLPEVS